MYILYVQYLYTLNYLLLTYLFTYLLIPWSRVLERLTRFQLVKKFPAFFGTLWFITTFTNAHHLSLSCTSLIQSIPPHPTSWRSLYYLPIYAWVSKVGSFLQVSPPNPVYTSPIPHTHYMPSSSHSRFYHPNNIRWSVQIIKLLIMYFRPLPCHLRIYCTGPYVHQWYSHTLYQMRLSIP